MRGTILYSGALAQTIRQGGLTWFHLQFLLGFRRLGYDVIFLDRIEEGMCLDEDGRPAAFADSVNRRGFLAVMRDFGLEDCFSLDVDRGREVLGLSRAAVLAKASSAAITALGSA